MADDNRMKVIKLNGDGSQFLANDGSYKTIPSKLSEFNNDVGFLTEIPEDYITKDEVEEEVNGAISELIDSAPETLDTLGEIATALNSNTEVIDILN
jgi:energy-coupling factor transporter ATP-binding protein EcfA2